MTIEISDNPELQTHLVAQMGQGISVSQPDAPKQTDISNFKALSGVSDKGEDTKAVALVDQFGNSKNTAALPEVYNAGLAQQADRTGHNVPTQQDDKKAGKVEDGDKSSAQSQASADKADAEAGKQDKISSLTSRIQQLQQQLASVDVQISSAQSGESSGSGENPGAQLGQLSSQRGMLVSMIQSLQQQLSTAQAE